jgi:hypothetical protein
MAFSDLFKVSGFLVQPSELCPRFKSAAWFQITPYVTAVGYGDFVAIRCTRAVDRNAGRQKDSGA